MGLFKKFKKYVPKYFTEKEFKAVGCSLSDMSEELLRMLDVAREKAGIPFIITSALRTEQDELSHGRSGNSAHTRGRAVDIACSSSWHRWRIVSAAIEAGFHRIGIADTYIHLDIDDELLPSPRIWLYTS